MKVRLILLIFSHIITVNCFSQSIVQLIYDNSLKDYNVISDNGMFQSKNSWNIDFVYNYMPDADVREINGGLAVDLGLKSYDFSNAHISKNIVTRFEFGLGFTGSAQTNYKGFMNGVTVSVVPVLLFSGWAWGEGMPQFDYGVKLTADANIGMISLGISYYPFKQKVFTEKINYYFEPNMQLRIGFLFSNIE